MLYPFIPELSAGPFHKRSISEAETVEAVKFVGAEEIAVEDAFERGGVELDREDVDVADD